MGNQRFPGRVFFACAVVFCIVLHSYAGTPAVEMKEAAVAWLKSAPDLKAKALLEVKSGERLNWNYVPMARKGVSLGEMKEKQREGIRNLLRTALSQRGFLQATTIVSLEDVLKEMEKSDFRDRDKYYLTLFGNPETNATWGWRFEGHHLSLNFMIVDGKNVTVAPSFFGSNPAESSKDGKVTRPLDQEEDLARALAKSLDADQKRSGIFSETAPREIITGSQQSVKPLEPKGIAFSKLNTNQQQQLKSLVSVYVNRYRRELAEEDLERISKAGWEAVSFVWAGALEKGQGHYYRIQGPTFLLEYDNTQNRANHIHTVWRDLERDFGGDLLREHYATSGHHEH